MKYGYLNIRCLDGIFDINKADVPVCTKFKIEEIICDDATDIEAILHSVDFDYYDCIVIPISRETANIVKIITEFIITEYSEVSVVWYDTTMHKANYKYPILLTCDSNNVVCIDNMNMIENPHIEKVNYNDFISTAIPMEFGEYYFTAMMNGTRSFLSGVYPENMDNYKVKHIGLDPNVRFDDLDLQNICDLNSALFFKEKENPPEYGVDSFQHIHNITSHGIIFDGGKGIQQIEIMPYSDYHKGISEYRTENAKTYYLRLDSIEDFESFKDDLTHYIKKWKH